MKKTQFSALKRSAAPFVIGVGLLAAATPAMAQDTSGEGADAGSDATAIVVTGTRIKQPNLESASPVTVISNAEFKQTGTTRVEDLVNSLPQVFAGQGANVSNGATGAATLDLRGLGSERTLVLVNGRRVVPGDPSTSAADINVIPAALIKRVDVLTGGASSVYGADAVSGVVNFVLDTDFEGFRIDTQYSMYTHRNRNKGVFTEPLDNSKYGYPRGTSVDGGTFDATIAFGTGFGDGRGHATAYFGYRKINPVVQANRDYSACALSARRADQVAANGRLYDCGGSATSPTGTIFAYDSNDPRTSSFTSLTYQFGPNRTLLPGATTYNFAPNNYFQRPDEPVLEVIAIFRDFEERVERHAGGARSNLSARSCLRPSCGAKAEVV